MPERDFVVSEDYAEYIYRLFGSAEHGIKICRTVTFVVTEDCCLKCSYCYESKKSKKHMTIETGKQIVDYLFELYEKDEPDGFINKQTKALILDFIGGEPLLEIGLIKEICDYFWKKTLESHNPWADNFRISITTNGIMYFQKEVQDFIDRYKNRLSFTITIDGDKEMHDKCRVHPDGTGSWDEAWAAETDMNQKFKIKHPGTKVTISPENLPYLVDTVRFFIQKGYREIVGNPIYEHTWTVDEAKLYYRQLIEIADMMLDSYAKGEVIRCALFDDFFFNPIPETENHTWCGGSGDMLAFDTEGVAYPCLRYMEISLNGEQKPLIIGDCYRGIYQDACEKKLLEELKGVTRRSQNTDECYYCPIARGCASCTAWDYQSSGSLYKRSTNICWMHKARSLANVYYWNKLYRLQGLNDKRMKMYLPKVDALKIVTESEYHELESLAE
jgi:radical SAM peptide maturase (CXXX-repeat target family)